MANFKNDINLSEEELKKYIEKYKKSNCVLTYDVMKENSIVIICKNDKGLIFCKGADGEHWKDIITGSKAALRSVLNRYFNEKYKENNEIDKFHKTLEILDKEF